MVVITNGIKRMSVPAGAVKPFLNMGYHVESKEERQAAEEIKPDKVLNSQVPDEDPNEEGEPAEEEDGEEEPSADDAYVAELLEKPISQWSNDEVKNFVKIKGIETAGVQKISQVRDIIKNYLNEQAKRDAE